MNNENESPKESDSPSQSEEDALRLVIQYLNISNCANGSLALRAVCLDFNRLHFV